MSRHSRDAKIAMGFCIASFTFFYCKDYVLEEARAFDFNTVSIPLDGGWMDLSKRDGDIFSLRARKGRQDISFQLTKTQLKFIILGLQRYIK